MLESLLEVVFPEQCATCEKRIPKPGFCQLCSVSLVEFDSGCIRCAEPNSIGLCIRCRRSTPPFHAITAPYLYGGEIAIAIRKFKFQKQAYIARSLAEVARSSFRRASEGIDIAVPVPLHAFRMAVRGFNQSQELLRQLATGLPIVTGSFLKRRGWQKAQSKLGGATRFTNLEKAFHIPRAAKPKLSGKRILIVDDVVSTTATMRAAAATLLEAGAAEITGFCIARVEA